MGGQDKNYPQFLKEQWTGKISKIVSEIHTVLHFGCFVQSAPLNYL